MSDQPLLPSTAPAPSASPAPTPPAEARTLYLVDGSYYMYRAFFAAPKLTTRQGFPTGALLLFINMLLSLIKEEKPSFLAVAFDPDTTFRHRIFPDYKANRSAPPPELTQQRPFFQQLTTALGLCALEVEDFEADDVIGTLARAGAAAGLHVVMVSGDKDLMQLIDDPSICMLDTMSSRRKRFTSADVIERFQVPPSRVAEVLALSGDSSDNIPGVPGVGEKTAGALIVEFGSLSNLLNNTAKITAKKRRESVEDTRSLLPLFLDLTTIRTDLPLPFDLADLSRKPLLRADLRALLSSFEFHKLIKDLDLDTPDLQATSAAAGDASSPSATAAGGGSAPAKRYEAVFEMARFQEILTALRACDVFAVDLETTSVDPVRAEIVGVSLAWLPDEGVYIPLRHRYIGAPQQLPFQPVLDALKPLLEAEHPAKVAQHAKYESVIFSRHGIRLRGLRFDPMLASYLLDPTASSHGLDALAEAHLRYRTIRFEDVAGKGKNQRRFDEIEVERAAPYAAEDADVTLLLTRALSPLLDQHPALRSLLHDVELPTSDILAAMELRGVRVDPAQLHAMSLSLAQDMRRLDAQALVLLGAPVNLNSPKQLADILYNRLQLKPASKKATVHGQSTDQDTLETLIDQHPLPALILEYRSLSKLRSTYADALTALIHPATQRVHTHFNQAVTATGRLSSSGPNLQNIPARTDAGRRIRRAFIPADGWVFLCADYSQIELRLLAHCSQDPALLSAFAQDLDIHALTAAAIHGVEPSAVTSDQRRAGKTVNFSVIYGVGAQHLARDLSTSRDDAQRFIDGFFSHYALVQPFFDGLIRDAQQTGFVTTLLGRRRPIPELLAGREHVQKQGERFAINSPIQGSAADIIKLAMIHLDRALSQLQTPLRAHLLLQVHDELVFEVHPDDLLPLAALVRHHMATAFPLRVPLKVDLSSGTNWADTSPLSL
jgi:DNA polymerase-1